MTRLIDYGGVYFRIAIGITVLAFLFLVGSASALTDDFSGIDGSLPNSAIWSLWTSNPESTTSIQNNMLELLGYQNFPNDNGKATVFTNQNFVLNSGKGIDVQVKIDSYENGGPHWGARIRIGPSNLLSFPPGYDFYNDSDSVSYMRQPVGSDSPGFYVNNNLICNPAVSEPFTARITATPGGKAALYINGVKQCEDDWTTNVDSFKVWLVARSGGTPGEWGKYRFDDFSATAFLSNSGGGSWQHNRNLSITNPGNALTDYQMLLNLTGVDFPIDANASGDDIRFTDSSGELPYWIERWDFTNRSGKVWVNVTNIPSGESPLHLWYGNPNATSSSNGKLTFPILEDFEDGDYTSIYNWTGDASYFTVQSGVVYNGSYSIRGGSFNTQTAEKSLTANFSDNGENLILESYLRMVSGMQWQWGIQYLNSSGDVIVGIQKLEAGTGGGHWDWWDITGMNVISVGAGNPYPFTADTWERLKIVLNRQTGKANYTLYNEDGTIAWNKSNLNISTANISKIKIFGYRNSNAWGGDRWFYADNILIRKYVSQEPFVNMIGYINGTVQNNSIGIVGAIVTTNTGINATTNASGFYSMLLSSGEYNLTAVSEPRFYVNNSINVNVIAGSTTTQDIDLLKKSTGNVSGNVSVK